jgi:hypothetical protein
MPIMVYTSYLKPKPLLWTRNQYNKFQNKTMLKFKPSQKVNNPLTNNVVVVMDRSGSMSGRERSAVDSLNRQLASLRAESTKFNVPTFVTIITFNEASVAEIVNTPISDVGDIEVESFRATGNTSLYNAISNAIDSVNLRSGVKQIIVITDGEENSSRFSSPFSTLDQIKDRITSLTKTDQWTFVGCVPPHHSYTLTSIGFVAGNVTEWELSNAGLERLTTSISYANTTRYDELSRGVTYSCNYFSPQVDNLAPSIVQTNLDDLSNQFQILPVAQKEPISSFVARTTGKPYRLGKAFYQLTKPETVQASKEVLLRDKMGRIYGGDNSRALLRIPAGGEIKLNPASSTDYEVYIKSTSHNRNLMPNTNVLVQK